MRISKLSPMVGSAGDASAETDVLQPHFHSLRSLGHIFWLRRGPLLGAWVLLSLCVGGLLSMFNLPHSYSAETVLRFPEVVGAENNMMHDVAISDGASITSLFTSYQVLEATVKQLALRIEIVSPEVFRRNTVKSIQYSESLPLGTYSVDLADGKALVRFQPAAGGEESQLFVGALPPGNSLALPGLIVAFDSSFVPKVGGRTLVFRFTSTVHAVGVLRNNLSVSPLGGSNWKVVLSDRDPFLVADILNTLRDQFLRVYYGTTDVQDKGVLVQMEQDLNQAKQRLDKSQNALSQYYAGHPSLVQPANAARPEDNLAYLEGHQQLVASETQKKKVELAFQAEPAKEKKEERYFWALDLLSDMAEAGDPHADILRGRLTELYNQLVTLKSTLGPEHPRLLEAYAKMDDLYGDIENAEKSLDKTLDQNETDLRQKVAQSASAPESEAPVKVHLQSDNLNQVYQNDQQTYDHLLESYNRAKLVAGAGSFKVAVVDEARPASYLPPSLKTRLAIAAAAVLLLGFLVPAAFGLHQQLFRKIWTTEDLKRLLRLKFLGSLPESSRPTSGTWVKPSPDPHLLFFGSAFTLADLEAFRMIREEVESFFTRPEKPGKLTLMVTSALPEEGKTLISSNLALTFARKGKRTLLIDADFRLGRLAQAFHITPTSGLDEMLGQEHLVLEEFLRAATWCYMPSVQKNLVLLPRKNFNPNAGELVSSEKFKAFVRMVGEQFDIVIIDTPPMAITSDPLAVAEMVDGVIFVGRSGSTPLSEAQASVERLRERNIRVGAVLNGLHYSPFEHNRYKKYAYYYSGGLRLGAPKKLDTARAEDEGVVS